MRREAREGGRCAEEHANWRSVAALNHQKKRKKAEVIEGENEGARYGMQERGYDLGFFTRPLVLKD